jgi:hypothetical protein
MEKWKSLDLSMGRADSWDKILRTPLDGCSWLEFTPADVSCRYWPELQPARSERERACESEGQVVHESVGWCVVRPAATIIPFPLFNVAQVWKLALPEKNTDFLSLFLHWMSHFLDVGENLTQ